MKMEDVLLRIDARVEKLGDNQASMNVTLEKQEVTLAEHIRRTEANEAAVDLMRSEFAKLRHDAVTWGVLGKILAAGSTGVGILTGLLKLLGKL